MFRIAEIFVEDKNLPGFLRACAGLVTRMETPQPVVNAEVRNGKITEQTDGSIEELFWQHVRKRKLTGFSASDVRGFLSSIGRSPASSTYVTTRLRKRGLIKVIPKTIGKYAVTSRR